MITIRSCGGSAPIAAQTRSRSLPRMTVSAGSSDPSGPETQTDWSHSGPAVTSGDATHHASEPAGIRRRGSQLTEPSEGNHQGILGDISRGVNVPSATERDRDHNVLKLPHQGGSRGGIATAGWIARRILLAERHSVPRARAVATDGNPPSRTGDASSSPSGGLPRGRASRPPCPGTPARRRSRSPGSASPLLCGRLEELGGRIGDEVGSLECQQVTAVLDRPKGDSSGMLERWPGLVE